MNATNPQTIDELYEIVRENYPDATREGNTIAVDGLVDLDHLESMPAGCTITAGGYMELASLQSIGDGCTITAGRAVTLSTLQSLPSDCTITAGWGVYLPSLQSLPEGCTIAAEWGVYLPDDFDQPYRGQRLKSVDGIATLLHRPRVIRDATVWRASYLGFSEHHPIYVAQFGEHWAHGGSVREAIEDARIKAMHPDCSVVAETIRETGVVTREQYRAITGACSEGVRRWCQAHGIADDTESIPLDRVLELVTGDYGAEAFAAKVKAEVTQ